MVQGVTVIHLGRCGSTVLGNLLNQHSQITWFREILKPLIQRARKAQGYDCILKGDPTIVARKALDNCQTLYGGVEFKPFHFEIFQLSQAECISRIRAAGFERIIVLDRRNRLRKIVSNRLAAKTGVWHLSAQAQRKDRKQTLEIENLQVDRFTGTLLQSLEMYDAQFRELRKIVSPQYLDLVYEDDIEADPKAGYRRVIEFLGLTLEPVKVKLGRTSIGSLREELENFDAVARHLAGTRYEWMLES